jgi:hypothetical protein
MVVYILVKKLVLYCESGYGFLLSCLTFLLSFLSDSSRDVIYTFKQDLSDEYFLLTMRM